jgi:heme-degrading monooxygenase HmoA
VITSDRASLAIHSETHPAADVSAVLGLEPSRSYERGDRFGRGLVRASSGWILDAPPADAGSAEDSRLDVLVRMLRGAAPALARLRADYDTEIGYTGFADSEHGSFAFSAETVARLAELGCGLTGSVYLEEPEPEPDPAPAPIPRHDPQPDADPGVLEQAVLPVIPGREAEFEAAFAAAQRIIARSPGFRDLRLARGVERPGEYLLLVGWDSLDAHQNGFRGSAAYDEWRALLHRFYDPFPEVVHFTPVSSQLQL